jgi:hypothetical protein
MRLFLTLLILGQSFLSGFQPRQEVNLIDVQVNYEFNQKITISGGFNSIKNISSSGIVLQFENGQTYEQEFSLITPSNFSLDFVPQQINALPFSRIFYWFIIVFEDGTHYASPSYWFDYVDDQFSWKNTSSKWFEVFWASEDSEVGQNIQAIALEGLKSSTSLLPVSPKLPIKIFVYPDNTSLQIASGKTTVENLSGTALLDSNTILVSESDDLTKSVNFERQIPHEITHLLEYQLSQSNYGSVPAWLIEGLATLAENYKDADQARVLKQANLNNSLLPLEQLCDSFPTAPAQLTLAYAESASFTQFLVSKYGQDKVTSLLSAAGNGLSCQQLVKNTLSLDLSALETEWLNGTLNAKGNVSSWVNYWPVVVLVLALTGILLLVRNHNRPHQQSGAKNDSNK